VTGHGAAESGPARGWRHGERLADHTTLHLGGPAGHFFTADSDADLVAAVRDIDHHRAEAAGHDGDDDGDGLLLLGGGSNLVVGDAGFGGAVIRIATAGIEIRDGLLSAAAGVPWDECVAAAVDAGLAGIECLSGIPGSTGATPIQNVGAYGQDVSQTVVMVDAYDRAADAMALLDNADCGFSYRHSAFKAAAAAGAEQYVVTRVHFQLSDHGGLSAPVRFPDVAKTLGIAIGEQAPLKEVRAAVLEQRGRRGMVLNAEDHDTWSAGSFFTNPLLTADQFETLRTAWPHVHSFPEADGRTKIPAAWLIEQAGFTRGYGPGPVTLSTKHTLALTNRGAATTADLLALAAEVRGRVAERFGVVLVPEPVLIGCALPEIRA
jgi:UDP-N-acetylmuramate dehydrogenase